MEQPNTSAPTIVRPKPAGSSLIMPDLYVAGTTLQGKLGGTANFGMMSNAVGL
jgi:hypothetical protein